MRGLMMVDVDVCRPHDGSVTGLGHCNQNPSEPPTCLDRSHALLESFALDVNIRV